MSVRVRLVVCESVVWAECISGRSQPADWLWWMVFSESDCPQNLSLIAAVTLSSCTLDGSTALPSYLCN